MTDDYTPTTQEVRDVYVGDEFYGPENGPAFDRWLDKVTASARAPLEAKNADLTRLLLLAQEAISEDARLFRELGDGLSRILEQLEEIDLASGAESKGVERLRALRNRIPE